ncbi:MAG: hypothetical protein L6V93_17350 [Clostridiales bacterium]|nr:MAG: hypothetical protein L6V93_17350 [Clostridiales bacterium]
MTSLKRLGGREIVKAHRRKRHRRKSLLRALRSALRRMLIRRPRQWTRR